MPEIGASLGRVRSHDAAPGVHTRDASGHIYRRDTERVPPGWYARIKHPDGRRERVRLGHAWDKRGRPPEGHLTEAMARRALRRLLDQADRAAADGTAPPRRAVTFAEACAAWLNYVERDRGRRDSTIGAYAASREPTCCPASAPTRRCTASRPGKSSTSRRAGATSGASRRRP